MNREIKFRAWDTIKKEMKEVGSIHFDDTSIWLGHGISEGNRWGNMETAILMQFTGLTDKNGKEIYEGDIFSFSRKDNDRDWSRKGKKNFPVIFEDGAYYVDFGTARELIDIIIKDKETIMEVIGNIYEHSHLLNK